MTTGQRIQQARRRAGLSQRELGEKMGLSASMIGQWENDLRTPKFSTLERISWALEVPTLELYGLQELDNPDSELCIILPQNENLTECTKRICSLLFNLNDIGLQKAVERIEELTEIPRYQKELSEPPQAPTPPDSEIALEDDEKPSESR